MPCELVYLSLGSNLGDRRENLEQALIALESNQVQVLKRSSIYETEPRDVTAQPWFLNMVVLGKVDFSPPQLLTALQTVERNMGRTREGKPPRGPRVLDIDILLYGSSIVQTRELQIPHPRMSERRFVLEPLLEIAPDARDPQSNQRFADSLAGLKKQVARKWEDSGVLPLPSRQS